MEINGYENYLIHEDGTVYSKITKKFLKPQKRNRYYRVGLSNNCKAKMFSINRLVAEHYIPNPENKPEVDHIDNNPLNNIFFYLMILCMIGIDYFSFYNGAIQGTDKAIKQFTEQINIRENILNKLDEECREINENKLNND